MLTTAARWPHMDWPALPVPAGRPADFRVEVGVVEVCMGGMQRREGAPSVLQAPAEASSLMVSWAGQLVPSRVG